MLRAVLRSKGYRTLVLVVVVSVALTATVTILGNRADAAITTAFSSRFQANVNGSILLRGNTSMVCPPALAACTDGQNGIATGNVAGTLNNNNYVMQYADADNDASTFNDSTTTIGLPAGSKVLFAGLYWSADTTAGNSGSAARSAADKGNVRFRTPAGSSWNAVTASTVFTNSTNSAYQGFADVTSLVSGAGNGVYSVADIQAGTGKDRYAGWALAIAYQNSAEPMHSLRIFDGFGVVNSNSADSTVKIPVSGFQTPQNGTVHASIGTIVYEGDLGLTGDNLMLDGQPMSDTANPQDNFFNSTVSQAGANLTSDRSPGNKNLMGVDIDQFDASGKLNNNVQNAELTLTTGGETFYPGVVTFTTDLFAPDVQSTVTGADVDGGDLLPGDVIEYTITVKNDGTDTALQTVLTNAIPTHTTYVPGSLTVAGAPRTDAAGDDTAQFAGGTATYNVGTLAHNDTTTLTFRVKVDTDTPAGYSIANLANSTYKAQFTGMTVNGVPATTSMTVQQPHADLSAALSVSPTAVQRAAAPNGVTYTVVVTNNGTDLEPAAKAELTLPTGVTAGSLPSGCTVSGQVVTCPAGALLKNTQATFTIPATVAANAAASAVASVQVSGVGADSVGPNNTASATLRVNSAPQAVADTANTTNGVAVTIDVRQNDSDPDNARTDLVVTLGTQPAHGNAVVNADGTITYTPVLGWAGADSFGYSIADGEGGNDTTTVTVTTANAAPVAVTDTRATGAGARIDIPVLDNDSDPNSHPIHVASITQPQAGAGSATLTGNVVSYTPAAGFAGTAAFAYVVEDSLGAQTTGQIRVAVGNAKPVAANDQDAVAYRGTVTIDVLANDTDPNNDPLTIKSVGTPNHGTATITAGKIVFAAPAGFSGNATFTYVVTDGSDDDTATVTVAVGNAVPTAADQSVHTATDTAVRIDALIGSNDPNGDALTVSGFTNPAHGSLALNADGTLTYTPAAAFAGNDSFDFTVEDGRGGADTKKVSIVVTNAAPVARPDSVTVPSGAVATIEVLSNDTDANNDPLTVQIDVAPQHGTATVDANGKVIYTPATGYVGSDSFHYTVADGRGGQAGATVTIGVVNTAPVARDDAGSTDTDTAVTITPLANDTDANGDALQVTAITAPARGTAVLAADGKVTYTPNAGYYGTDAFTYSIRDAHGLTATATITITVRNAAPIAVDDRFVVRPGVTTKLDLLANDRDPNTGQKLSIATLGTPAKGTVTLNADGTVGYRPNALTEGTDRFDYVLTDDLGLTATGTVTIVIDALPTAGADTAAAKGGTAVDIAVLANDVDPEGGALTLVSVGTPAHGAATIVDGKVRYLPTVGFSGTDTFTYLVRDPAGNTVTGKVTVTVANTAPVAADDAAAVLAGKPVDVDVLANDTDPNTGQTLTVTAVGTPAHGTATIVNGKIRYKAAADYAGVDTFTYTISDGQGGTAQATVTVTVSSGAAVAVPDERTTPYQQAITVPALANDLNPDKSLTLSSVSTPDHGTAVIVGGQVRYTPPAGFTGVAKFSYTAVDGDGNHVTTTVTITVGAPPVVPDKSLTAKPGVGVKIALPTVDEHGVPVTVKSIGQPKHGTAKLNADGTVTYLAAKGFSGTDTFAYEAMDANGNLAEGTITIKVAGVNTKPVAKNDNVSVGAGDSVVIMPLKNDTDANGDKLTVVKIGKPKHGTAVLNKDGTVTYAPNQSYAGGVDSFTYTVSDGHGGTTTAIITVTVNAAATDVGAGNGKLAKTGADIISVVVAGGIAVLIGGFLLVAGGNGNGLRLPQPIMAGLGLNGPGRHRPGRHRG